MKGILVLGFVVSLALGVGACQRVDRATGAPVVSGTVVVDNSIAAVERSFTLAMQVANLYTSQPRCKSPGATVICSDPKVVLMIRNSAIKAHGAILMARKNQAMIGMAANAVEEFSSVLPSSAK